MIDGDPADMILCTYETQESPPAQCAAAAGSPAAIDARTSRSGDHAPRRRREPAPTVRQGGVPMPAGRVAWAVRVPRGGPGGRGATVAVCADRAGGGRAAARRPDGPDR